ncbi:hypothetical protein LUX01_08615 [Streptomyces sudanensis]|uniref:hypothetical protein n=1 Tax=Streptomyces sudanensis TaxID=436397 RepID=UPI0020CD74CC|nr:hypothetical protein [Streptomyces sudanensis]MCP9986744.1 hypothetical protein [Streptomyces sudanensis]
MSPGTSTTPNLVELIERADERGLAAAALACLDRCLPLLDPEADDRLRPLWAAVAGGGADWADRLAGVRAAVGAGAAPADAEEAAPGVWAREPLKEWAGTCSRTALELHRRLCPAPAPEDAGAPDRDGADGRDAGPLAGGEMRRQAEVLEALADGAAAGLRRAVDLSAEGRRITRAVLSRRARTA